MVFISSSFFSFLVDVGAAAGAAVVVVVVILLAVSRLETQRNNDFPARRCVSKAVRSCAVHPFGGNVCSLDADRSRRW